MVLTLLLALAALSPVFLSCAQAFLKQVASGTPPPAGAGPDGAAEGEEDGGAGLLSLLQPEPGASTDEQAALQGDLEVLPCAGVALPSADSQYDVDKGYGDGAEASKQQLEVSPIAKYASEPREAPGSLVAADGRFIAYGLRAGQVRVLDAATAARALVKGHEAPLCDVALAPSAASSDGGASNTLASVGADGKLFVHRLEAGEAEVAVQLVACVAFGEVPEGSAPARVAWSADGATLAAAVGGRVALVHLSQVAGTVECPPGAFVQGVEEVTGCGGVTALAFSPSGSALALATRERRLFEVAVETATAAQVDFHCRGDATWAPLSFVAYYDEAHLVVGAADNTVLAVVVRDTGDVCSRLRLMSSAVPDGAFFNTAFLLATPFAGSVLIVANARAGAIYVAPITEAGGAPAFASVAEFAVVEPVICFTATIADEPAAQAPAAELYCMNAKAIQQYAMPLAACLAAEGFVADPLEEGFVAQPGGAEEAEEVVPPEPAPAPAPTRAPEQPAVAASTPKEPKAKPVPPPALLSPTQLLSPSALAAGEAACAPPPKQQLPKPSVKLLRRPAGEVPAATDGAASGASGAAPAAATSPPAANATAVSNAALESVATALTKVVVDAEERILSVVKATRGPKGGDVGQADALRALEDRVVKRVGDMLASREAEQRKRADRVQEGIKALTSALGSLPVAIAERVEASLRHELGAFGKALVPVLQGAASTAIESATSAGGAAEGAAARGAATAIAADLPAAAAAAVAGAFRSSFQGAVVPAIEAGMRQVMEQVGAGIDRGVIAASASAAPASEAVARLEAAADALQARAAELEGASGAVTAVGSGGSAPQSAVSLASLEQSLDPTIELRKFLQVNDFEGAFNYALSLSDVDVVAWLCTQVPPSGVAKGLSQGVLLSLTQQLGYNLDRETTSKLDWLQETVMALDTRSPTVAPHLKTVLGALLGQLQDAVQFCPPACASKLTLVTHVVNSLNNA